MATKAQSADVPATTGSGGDGDGVRRRDFLNVAAVSFAGVGGIAALAPLIVQMSPSADVLALATTEVDFSKVQPGQGIKAQWRKQPVFIRNLTPKEIAEADAVPLSELRDPQTLEFCARNGINPGYFLVYPRADAAPRYRKFLADWAGAGWDRKPRSILQDNSGGPTAPTSQPAGPGGNAPLAPGGVLDRLRQGAPAGAPSAPAEPQAPQSR